MFKRLSFVTLLGVILSLMLTSGVAFAQSDSPGDAPTVCHRIYGTDEWTRRCAPRRPDESRDAYCRRIFNTDKWTRRCIPRRFDGDIHLRAYCQRIYDTDEWTRRCVQDHSDIDRETYCRRIFSTAEWTRRCVSDRTDRADRTDRTDLDHDSYCRRIHGSDEWSRRCVDLRADTTQLLPSVSRIISGLLLKIDQRVTDARGGNG